MYQDSLMRFIPGRQSRNGFHGTVIAAIIACLIAATVWLVFYSADRLLRADAEAVAANWATKFHDQERKPDQVLAGAQPSPTTLEFLMSAREYGNFEQISIFDRDGKEVLGSTGIGAFRFLTSDTPDASTVGLVLAGQVHSRSGYGTLSGSRSYFTKVAVPIIGDDGQVAGVMSLLIDNGERRQAYLLWLGGMFAALVLTIALLLIVPGGRIWVRMRERLAAQADAEFFISHDPLTAISNRSHFLDQLAQTIDQHLAGGRQMALHYIDIDRFKEINDSFGLEAGDKFLQEISERLVGLVGDSDQIARIGSDEFAVIQPDISDNNEADALGDAIVSRLSGTYEVAEHKVLSSASIGIAMAPEHGRDALRLLKSADLALHQVKGRGRANKCIYTAGMDQSLQSRLELQSILHQAFNQSWFELHYQPQYDLSRKRLTGFEALLRLRHPERGMIPPSEFIPVAEESGLIVPIGEWIAREACQTAAEWPENLSLAINLSPAQIRESKLAETISEIMKSTGLEPGRLEVEITEGLLMDASELTMSELQKLKDQGVALVMDDFGTGYSSLSYLWRFEFDKIKIDRSFIHNLGSGRNVESLLRSIINIGQSLDLRVIAEGVEKPEQAHFLMKNSCHHVQGFLFGRPVPKTEVAAVIMRDLKNSVADEQAETTDVKIVFKPAVA